MMDQNPFKPIQEMLIAKPVPKVDVKEKVMVAIMAKKMEGKKIMKKKIGLLLIASMLVGASSVWAGMKMIELKNEKGEVVLTMSQYTDEEQQKVVQELPQEDQTRLAEEEKELERKSEIMTNIMNDLKPGTTAAVYWVPKNEEEDKNIVWSKHAPNITVVSNPVTYTSWKDMQPVVGKMFTLPTELGGTFKFNEGDVLYEDSDKYDAEAMKAEAKRDKKEYVVKEIPSSDKFDYATVSYRSEKGGIRAEVRMAEEGNAHTGTNAQVMEKVMVGNNEAVLTTHKSGNGDAFNWVIWIKNGTKLEYSLRASEKVVSKEELLKLAKQLNEVK
ncbi:hypothetical protein BRE01_15690 [Brevibacillus reuszeri]|uniref:DUF4367 domain-containing protein n=1 Tax=Brevibacillus reuszeri TaxID=54915 RepID=A0A0K9Z0M6_9BACL|nr:hypothetical protein [Brevibacillus reuszeri]KNB74509.1 hypothetical protein ADS79_02135 [Brevibacillus reuszeri]MED1856437.1 hypothetical protein [Brevibacillus reuszeri]GED67867.1 hypothetical protein BRE01_15690 [Brevibacillus reuszeri]